MKSLQQIVPWVAVGLAVIGVAVIFLKPRNAGPSVPPAEAALRVEGIEAQRSGDAVLLRLRVSCKNAGDAPLRLDARDFHLTAAGGEQVPPYVRPFLPVTDIPAGKAGSGELAYWLPIRLLSGKLDLDGAGLSAPVKSAGDFPAGQLAEGTKVTLTAPDWKVP